MALFETEDVEIILIFFYFTAYKTATMSIDIDYYTFEYTYRHKTVKTVLLLKMKSAEILCSNSKCLSQAYSAQPSVCR